MKVHVGMSLDDLILLMGERHGVNRSAADRLASKEEARTLRELLARDFDGQDTDEIPPGVWHAYCCAVEPTISWPQQASPKIQK